ncbi:MAG TPA: hypothetical protein PLK55_00050 [archaeon]|nr:hypothetical protein [archaeon]
MNRKGIITLELILCVLIIIIVLGFFININLEFKERLEKNRNLKEIIKIIKTNYYNEKNWEKYESQGTSNST